MAKGDISESFEEKHIKNLLKTQREIQSIFYEVIDEAMYIGVRIRLKSGRFILAKYPAVNRSISDLLAGFQQRVSVTILNGIDGAWMLSNEKNIAIVDKRFSGLTPGLKEIVYDPNLKTLEAFKRRKTAGLNLSDRVWKITDQFKDEIESTLEYGIREGKSAKKLASELKRNLREPDKLFRRKRNELKKLVESDPSKAYKPGTIDKVKTGPGIYKSSFKNALRVARTETNMAYRAADSESYKNDPLVKGMEIRLSDAHPKTDICDHLKGEYPQQFKFTGWHPNCLCYQIPILVSDKEFNEIEDAILTEKPIPNFKKITDIPANAKQWLSENKERIEGLKSQPYFIRDNLKMVGFGKE